MSRKAYTPYIPSRPCLMCGKQATGVLCPLCAGTADKKVIRRGSLSIRLDNIIRPAAATYWAIVEYLKFQPILQDDDCAIPCDGVDYLCLTLGELHYHVYLTPFSLQASVLAFAQEVNHLCGIARLWLPLIERLIDDAPLTESRSSIVPFTIAIGIDMKGTGPFGFSCDVLGRVVNRGNDMMVVPFSFDREAADAE